MEKKGFTLIELLAVIVILAIVALVATPLIMNTINDAKKGAFLDSARNILKAGDFYYSTELIKNEEGITNNTVFFFPEDADKLNFKGDKPKDGYMMITADGEISMTIYNGQHCVTKNLGSEDVSVIDNLDDCVLDIPKPLSNIAVVDTDLEITTVDPCVKNGGCAVGTPLAIQVNNEDTYKFYVLNDNGAEVTLMMDSNLYDADGNVNTPWISAEDYYGSSSDGGYGYVDQNSGIATASYGSSNSYGSTSYLDKGPLTALAYLMETTDDWENIALRDYTYADDNGTTSNYTSFTVEARARLVTKADLTGYGVNCNESSQSCANWVYQNVAYRGDNNTDGFWTSTTIYGSTTDVVTMDYYGSLTQAAATSTTIGVRPVITVSR